MAGKKQLEPLDLAARPVAGSVTEAAETGSRLDSLKALRSVVTRHIDSENTLARDLAALSRQYLLLSKEIQELEELEKQYGDEGGDAEDELSAESPFSEEAI
ncbi:hypothetical protein [Rothia sp. P5766]|uniref:hypothetical protein n=1 Tax=unclassified Rothia (in: high G+C Gram-positive bacteria) TaxID=2689056 RepID=UPI003AE3ACE9